MSQSEGPLRSPSPSMSIMNQERSWSWNGAVRVTDSSSGMLQFSPTPTKSPTDTFETSTMSSIKSMSESRAVGFVPNDSSSKFARPSSSVSRTMSQECAPSELARSSQSATSPSPLNRVERVSSIAWSRSKQSQFPLSGSKRVTSPPGV